MIVYHSGQWSCDLSIMTNNQIESYTSRSSEIISRLSKAHSSLKYKCDTWHFLLKYEDGTLRPPSKIKYTSTLRVYGNIGSLIKNSYHKGRKYWMEAKSATSRHESA